jgi:8-amino-3,8-dideoxy-alpha-D-manno-octulosonate transaminase
MEKLAIEGGTPVRKEPFPSNWLGVTMYGEEELAELSDVIAGKSPFRDYGLNNPCKTKDFEKKAREYIGTKFAVAVTSGSAALNCAVVALGIGPGDEVIIPAFGWFSNFFAVTNAGALPVFADIDETLSLDPEDFKKKITAKTKAVMVVDFQGCPAKMDEIMAAANERGIKVIEDIAQAFGSEYKGKKLGSIGHISIASFQINKMLCCGEGGMILTDDEKYFARAVRYHDMGFMRPVFAEQIQDKQLLNEKLTFSANQYRMNEFSGAVMLAQMNKLENILTICREHHALVRDKFKDNPHFTIRWVEGDSGVAVFMLFPDAEKAQKFQSCLSAEGIPVGAKSACRNMINQYPIKTKTLHHEALPPFGKGFDGEFANYEKLGAGMRADNILSRFVAIGIGPQYSKNDISDIIGAIEKVDSCLYNTER